VRCRRYSLTHLSGRKIVTSPLDPRAPDRTQGASSAYTSPKSMLITTRLPYNVLPRLGTSPLRAQSALNRSEPFASSRADWRLLIFHIIRSSGQYAV
jgi:hypothetical protein